MNKKPLLIILGVVIVGIIGFVVFSGKSTVSDQTQALPVSCVDQQEGVPVITSFSQYSGSIGTTIEINGCNFSGFEGDKIAVIENSDGKSAPLRGEADSTAKLIKITLRSPLCTTDNSYSGLPCKESLTVTPGAYKVYASAWGKKSNEVNFTVH